MHFWYQVGIQEEAFVSGRVDTQIYQDTVLGLLLFICHINDLPLYVTSNVRLSADDCLLYSTIISKQDYNAFQNDLSELKR